MGRGGARLEVWVPIACCCSGVRTPHKRVARGSRLWAWLGGRRVGGWGSQHPWVLLGSIAALLPCGCSEILGAPEGGVHCRLIRKRLWKRRNGREGGRRS